jgi:hypothetical protein
MAKRVCVELGCPELIDPPASRCTAHERARDKARGSSTARGYGSKHKALRAEWQVRIDSGKRVYCWRCGWRITGTHWQLGHCDDDRTVYHGPECTRCNLATAGRGACPHPKHN